MLIIIKYIPPALPSDEEPSAESICLINVLGPLVGAQVVSSNEQIIFDPDHVVLYSVDLKTQVQAAFVEKDNLVHFIQLVENNDVGVLVSWLQGAQQAHHEVTVVEVAPVVVSRLVRAIQVWNLKRFLVRLKEVLEQELCVNELLNLWRELVVDVQVSIFTEGSQSIIVPLVVKEVFNSLFQANFQVLLLVQVLDSQEELC